MKIGTKSLLFGTHQFLWHPWTVALAFRHIYKRWPDWAELVCIFFHDWGYWGCPDMDGEQGKRHPERGAAIAARVCFLVRYVQLKLFGAKQTQMRAWNLSVSAWVFTVMHSSGYAKKRNSLVSALFLPDKASILCEPRWFYLLRARLSGELDEYIANSPKAGQDELVWYEWYADRVALKVGMFLTRKS